MRVALQLCLISATFLSGSFSLKLPSFLEKRLPHIAAACIHVCLQTSLPMQASAGVILITEHAHIVDPFNFQISVSSPERIVERTTEVNRKTISSSSSFLNRRLHSQVVQMRNAN